jgi:hypothetical protein
MKIITFPRGKPCEIKASYAPTADLPPGTSHFIGKWVIPTVPPTESGEPAKVMLLWALSSSPHSSPTLFAATIQVRVKVKLDGNGIFSVEYAQMVENVVASKEEDKKESATVQSPKDDDEKKSKEGDEVCIRFLPLLMIVIQSPSRFLLPLY